MTKRPAPDHTDEIAWLEQLESLMVHGSDNALFAIDAGGTITAWRCDTHGAVGYGQDALVGRALASLFPDYEGPSVAELLEGPTDMGSRRLVMRTARGTYAGVELVLDGRSDGESLRLGSIRSVVEQQKLRGLLDSGRRLIQARAQRRTVERHEWDMRMRSTVTEYAHTVKQLQEAKEEARLIIATAHDAYVAIDAHSVILEWNRQAELTFGWSRDEAIGLNLSDTILPPQFRDEHVAGIDKYLRTGEGPLLNRRIEVPARHRAGHQFPVEMTIWTHENAEGKRFNAFLHDISERKQQERRTAARYAAVSALVECTDPGNAMPRVLDGICLALDWSVGLWWRVDDASGTLRTAAFHAAEPEIHGAFRQVNESLAMAPGTGLPGRVWQQQAPEWMDNFPALELPRTDAASRQGLHGAFAFPVVDGDRVLGVVEFFSTRVEPPDDALLAMMHDIGRLLGRFIARNPLA